MEELTTPAIVAIGLALLGLVGGGMALSSGGGSEGGATADNARGQSMDSKKRRKSSRIH